MSDLVTSFRQNGELLTISDKALARQRRKIVNREIRKHKAAAKTLALISHAQAKRQAVQRGK